MRPLLWLFLTFARLLGCKVVGLTLDGRGPYDYVRIATGGPLAKGTDGLIFTWQGCRIGYEPNKADLLDESDDDPTCSWCGEPWFHSRSHITSEKRLPRDRCETCARHLAAIRGVPWEDVR